MLPSTRLVCWSSTTLSIPASRNSAWAQDRRTTSLVRSSSFIGPWKPVPEAAIDTADRMRRISAAGHRRRDLRPGVRHLTYGGILCSLALGASSLPPAVIRGPQRGEPGGAGADYRSRPRRPASLSRAVVPAALG